MTEEVKPKIVAGKDEPWASFALCSILLNMLPTSIY